MILHLCNRWHLHSNTHLLAKFGALTMYVFLEKKVISSQAVSKQSKNMGLQTVVEQSCNEFPQMLIAFAPWRELSQEP